MSRLIKGAKFNPKKARQHVRGQDQELSDSVNELWEDAGRCFRIADPGAYISYMLSYRMTRYKSRGY